MGVKEGKTWVSGYLLDYCTGRSITWED